MQGCSLSLGAPVAGIHTSGAMTYKNLQAGLYTNGTACIWVHVDGALSELMVNVNRDEWSTD